MSNIRLSYRGWAIMLAINSAGVPFALLEHNWLLLPFPIIGALMALIVVLFGDTSK